MKKWQRVLIVSLCIVLLSLSLTVLFGTVYVAAFSKNNVNVENDERLFKLAHVGSLTEYYVDKDGFAAYIEEYRPLMTESIALGERKKIWVPITEVNNYVVKGFIAVEDRKFYSHSGVDLKRTLYALANSVFHFKDTFGASTITQQVIKNVSGDNEITFKRKLAEIIRAYNIERRHTKEEILEVYLNIVPMGENLYGIASASNSYFGKEPSELTLAEAATLIGITNAPTRYNPHKKPDECVKKRNEVLYAMYDFGVIDEYEFEEAKVSELRVMPESYDEEAPNSWFIETVNKDVIRALTDKYEMNELAAEALLYGGGLKIYTTQNVSVQKKLEEYFEDTSNFPSENANGLDFSMVICDSRNGNLLGIVGAVGRKSGDKLLNLALTPITPGSSLKPIALYAPLIESGKINWATVFDDVPLEFTKNGGAYTEYPRNYPRVYDGLTTVKDALRLSKNTVAVKLYNMLGAEEIYRSLKNDYGFDTLVRKSYMENGSTLTDLAPAPLALGQLSYGVTLRRLTEAYTVFPSDGKLTEGRSFIAVYDSDGELLLDNTEVTKRLYSKETARIMNKLLAGVTESGTASKVTLKNMIDTAGKTGTSGDDKDRVFVGYTPYITAGIWCGYREGSRAVGKISPTHISVWDDIMKSIHKDILADKSDYEIESFSVSGLQRRAYCKDSGKLYSASCALDPRGSRQEVGYFKVGDVPTDDCDRHIICKYDSLSEGVATDGCPTEYINEISLLKIEERHFPKEIIISDADYVYFETDGELPLGDNYDVPYYYNYIEEGDHVGRGKGKKQFNSSCYLHND